MGTKLTNDDVVALVRREINQAQGYDTDTLSRKRELALEYYQGIMAAPGEGCNESVSKDVADTVHSLLAEVGPIFQTSLIKFEPDSEEDERQAQLESDFVRRKFQQSKGEIILYEAAHDAILIGNGWIKVTVSETIAITNERYEDLDQWGILEAQKPTQPNQEVTISGSLKEVNVRRETSLYDLVVECVPPENMIFSANQAQNDVDNIRMIGERVFYTVDDLIGMGLSKDEATTIPDYAEDNETARRARDGIYADEIGDTRSYQEAERLKECFDIHINIDLTGDGRSELRHIVFGGSVLISDEPAECAPYATGSPVPMPHRIQGTGMYEIMGSVQDSKTDILRKFIDNVDVLNKSRTWAVEGEVNMKDLTAARSNGVVRVAAPGMIGEMPATDAGVQCITALNYMDTVRSQRGGASVDQNNADRQVMQSSATAAAGVMQTAERTSGWYAHNLVNTLLAETYRLMHKKLRLEMPGEVSANLRGKWVKTDPGQWKERKSIEVLAGLTTTERNNKINGLNQVIMRMDKMLMEGGDGIITNRSKLYGAMSDWIVAAEIGQPEEYLIDPESKEAQEAQQKKAQQASQAQQQQMQMQNQIMQMQKQIEDQKVEYDYYKTNAELKFKYYDAQLDAEVEETKMTLELVKQPNEPDNA